LVAACYGYESRKIENIKTSTKIALAFLVLLKIVLGVAFVNYNSIDLDEPFTIFHAQKSVSELWQLFAEENNPPLHFYLLHFWIKLFGISALAVRSLSLIFGVFTVLVLFDIGRKLRNETLGLLVALIFVGSSYQHYFSLEARTYALLILLFATAFQLLISFKMKPVWWKSLLFTVNLGLLIYAHYIALLVVPILVATFFFWATKGSFYQRFKSVVLIIAPTLLLIAPLLRVLLQRIEHVQSSGTWLAAPKWNELYGVFIKYLNGFLPALCLVLLALLFLFLNRKINKETLKTYLQNKWMLVLFPTISIYFVAYFISIFTPHVLFFDRYLIFLSLGFYIVFAGLVLALPAHLKYAGLLVVLIFLIGFKPTKGNNRASDELARYAMSFDGSYFISPPYYDLTFLYHFNQDYFKQKKSGNELNEINVFPVYNLDELDLNKLKYPIVFIDAASEFVYGDSKMKTVLDSTFVLQEERNFLGDYVVYVYGNRF